MIKKNIAIIMMAIMLSTSLLAVNLTQVAFAGKDNNNGNNGCEKGKGKACDNNPNSGADLFAVGDGVIIGTPAIPDQIDINPAVGNSGPDTAINTVMTITNLSPDVGSFAQPLPSSCTGDSLIIMCNMGPETAINTVLGETIQVDILTDSPFEFYYEVKASSDTPDPNLDNNTYIAILGWKLLP